MRSNNNLEILQIIDASISELDLRSNNNLKDLFLTRCHELRGLDVSGLEELHRVSIPNNLNLRYLCLVRCYGLQYLDISGTGLQFLDLSGYHALQRLDMFHTEMQYIDLSTLTELMLVLHSPSSLALLPLGAKATYIR